MRKFILVFCLLSLSVAVFYSAQAENVVRLQSVNGLDTDYKVSELLRVEFVGDSIRFIASDGTLTAQVYKYDYAKLVIADKEEQSIDEPMPDSPKLTAKKILINGKVYILLGDKAYLITGQEVK